jgi:hypothetical protein
MEWVLLFYPTIDVFASVASMLASSPADSGQSVMSSTSTSSYALDYHGPTVSFDRTCASGLGFETLFVAMDLFPISPFYAIGRSSSTRVKLIDLGSEVVTSSSSTILSSCIILSLRLLACQVTLTNYPSDPNFSGIILCNYHNIGLLLRRFETRAQVLFLTLISKFAKC